MPKAFPCRSTILGCERESRCHCRIPSFVLQRSEIVVRYGTPSLSKLGNSAVEVGTTTLLAFLLVPRYRRCFLWSRRGAVGPQRKRDFRPWIRSGVRGRASRGSKTSCFAEIARKAAPGGIRVCLQAWVPCLLLLVRGVESRVREPSHRNRVSRRARCPRRFDEPPSEPGARR